MKTITCSALVLLTCLASPPTAEQQAAPELQPSLAFLKTVSTPMPDFHGVAFYDSMPDSQGTLTRGIGHSDWVRGWFRQMEPVPPRFAKFDDKLGLDVGVYGDTVREEGEKVLATTAGLKKSLTDIDRVTLEKVQDLLATYHDEVKAAQDARKEFEAASKRADQATYLLDASDADAKECNAVLEKSKLETEKATLLAKVEKGAAFLNSVEKALDAVAGGPQAMAAYVASTAETMTREGAKALILDAFYSGTRDQLYEIGLKIEAIDKSLQDLKCKSQAASLKAAKSNLEARMIQVVLAFGKILDHRANAWRAVDRLGTLQDPRSGRKVPFFQALQAYNSQINTMGRTVFDSVDAYLEFLNKEPVSRGPVVYASVKEDMATVNAERAKRDPRGEWLSKASETRAYLERYTDWYEGEVTRGQRILTDLREGRHLDFVDRMMARAAKELGGTVSYSDIIR